MLWIFGYLLMGITGVGAIIWGVNGIRRGRIKFGNDEYEGARARTVGIEIIIIGLFFLGAIVAMWLLVQ